MNSTVGGEQRKLGFNKRTRFIFFEVLVLLPSTSRSTVAPLLAVPAVLIILREILVSALREWTALAGLDLGTLGTLGMLRTGRSWSVVVDLFWAEETGVDFFLPEIFGDDFSKMKQFWWVSWDESVRLEISPFFKRGNSWQVGFFSAKSEIFFSKTWDFSGMVCQEYTKPGNDGNGGSFLRHA